MTLLNKILLSFVWIIAICFMSCNNIESKKHVITGNIGITKIHQTLKVPIPSKKEERFLLVENPHINTITLHDNENKLLDKSGDIYPFHQRPFKHRFFIFPISQKEEIDTINITLDKKGENLSYVIRIVDHFELDQFLEADSMLVGGILGFYGLALLIAIGMIFSNRTIKHVYFFLYMLFSLAWLLNDAGIFFEIMWPNSPLFHKSSRGFFSSISMILFALYLSKNVNKMLIKGIRSVTIALISLLFLKLILAIFVSFGYYPDSIKYISMYLNAVVLLGIFMSISVYLIMWIVKNKKDVFEILGILTYCFFVITLLSKELGAIMIYSSPLHHFDAILFFPFQCFFMAINLYEKERERKMTAERALLQYKIEQNRILDKKIIEVEENEKKRISQNIHDEIGSIFVALKYRILSLKEKLGSNNEKEKFDELIQLTETGIKKQYSIIDDLLFEFKTGDSFEESIRKHIDLMLSREDIASEFNFQTDETQWSDFQKIQTFRIISELLTNTIKHASANSVELEICGTKSISISYSDNGKGLDQNNISGGRGLDNIKMRINALMGKLNIVNNGVGLTYHITFELPHE